MVEVTVTDPGVARVDISVIVTTGGSEPGLPDTVRSLLTALDHAAVGGTDHPDPRAAWLRGARLRGEVVLVAGDVEPLTVLLPHPDARVRVVAAPGVSEGRARNLGVAAARGRYLLFTDAEVRVPDGWVLAMTAPLRAGHADLVGGAVRLASSLDRPWLTPDLAADFLDVVPDLPVPGGALSGRALSGIALGVSRAVLEVVGFDEELGTARYPVAGDRVFRRDVIGVGFREQVVVGYPVERHLDPRVLDRRQLAARARAHGRGAAYLDRHLRDARPGVLSVSARLVACTVGLAVRAVLPGSVDRSLRTQAAVAYHCTMLRLIRAPYRPVPPSAAGDLDAVVPARRSVERIALVSRGSVPPTALPTLAARSAAESVPDEPGRGSVYRFWGPGRAAPARGSQV